MPVFSKCQHGEALYGFLSIVTFSLLTGVGIVGFALLALVYGFVSNILHSISLPNLVGFATLARLPTLPSWHKPCDHPEYPTIIFELQEQLAQVTHQKQSLAKALAQQQDLAENFEARYTQVQIKLIKKIDEQRREFEGALHAMDSALKRERIAYGKLSNSEYGAKIQIKRLQESIDKDADKAAIESLKNQVEDLNKQLTRNASEKDAVAADLGTQLAQAQSERDAAVQRLRDEQANASQKKTGDVESLTAQIQNLQSEKDSIKDEADSRLQAMQLEQEREKKKMIKEATNFYHHLIGQNNNLKSENTRLQSLVDEVAAARADLQSANASIESQYDAFKATNNDLVSTNATLTSHLSTAECLINAFMQGGGAADEARDYVLTRLKGTSTTPEEPSQPPATDPSSIPSAPPTGAPSDPAAPGPSNPNPATAPQGAPRKICDKQDVFSESLAKALTCHKCGEKGHQHACCPQLLKCIICGEVRGDFTHTTPWCQAQPGRSALCVSADEVRLDNEEIVREYERAHPGLKAASMGARAIKGGKRKGKVV